MSRVICWLFSCEVTFYSIFQTSLNEVLMKQRRKTLLVILWLTTTVCLFWYNWDIWRKNTRDGEGQATDALQTVFPMKYRPRPEVNVSEDNLALLDALPYKDFLDSLHGNTTRLTHDNANDFVFVTATNKNYFYINMDAIGNVQKFLPNYTLIFYDLEENRSPREIQKISQMCDVIYRRFNFTRYPKHVRELKTYAFKPIIILEVLREYPGIFWIDSSIRFLSGNLSGALDQAVKNGGIMTFGFAFHTIFPATHSRMFLYLPIPKERAVSARVREAGCLYVYRTKEIYENVIRWWVACALVENCMAPTRDLSCKFTRNDVYANCHRFDQSAVNILMANYFLYDDEAYF